MSWFNLVRRLPALWQNERTRNQLLGGVGMLAGISGAIAGYAYWREPMQVRLDRLTVKLPNAKGHLPHHGLRLLHISDTHFRGAEAREQSKIESIRKACAGLSYDLLIHTGDFLHEDSGLPNVLTLLDALPAPRLGGYAVFGNHDYCTYSRDQFWQRTWLKFWETQGAQPEYTPLNGNGYNSQHTSSGTSNGYNGNVYHRSDRATRVQSNGSPWRSPLSKAWTLYKFGRFCATSPLDFKRTGTNNTDALEAALAERKIQILHNRYVRLTHVDSDNQTEVDIYLAGVDDVVEGNAELRRALAEIPYDAPTILLSHNPDILVEPGIEQADLVLSGHTHGGQIVLPLFGPAHTQTEHLRRREASGYLRRGKTQVYITRGVGEGIPIRLGASPQITLITVVAA